MLIVFYFQTLHIRNIISQLYIAEGLGKLVIKRAISGAKAKETEQIVYMGPETEDEENGEKKSEGDRKEEGEDDVGDVGDIGDNDSEDSADKNKGLAGLTWGSGTHRSVAGAGG